MGELTRDDVYRTVQECLRDIRSDLARIREEIQRVDKHTNVLDESQREFRGFAGGMQRMLDQLFRRTQQGAVTPQDLLRLREEVADMRLRTVAIEHSLQQIVTYIQNLGRADKDEQGFQHVNARR